MKKGENVINTILTYNIFKYQFIVWHIKAPKGVLATILLNTVLNKLNPFFILFKKFECGWNTFRSTHDPNSLTPCPPYTFSSQLYVFVLFLFVQGVQ